MFFEAISAAEKQSYYYYLFFSDLQEIGREIWSSMPSGSNKK